MSIIVQALIDLLVLNKTSLGIEDVYYGDQNRIPKVPSISVQPGDKSRVFTQTGLHTTIGLPVYIIIFHSGIRDLQVTNKANDVLAEAVETLLHADITLGGLVISSLVESVEPGFANRGKEYFVTHRLTWNGLSKKRIGA